MMDQMHSSFVYHYSFSKCTIVYYPLDVPDMCVHVVLSVYLCMFTYVICTSMCAHTCVGMDVLVICVHKDVQT